MSYADWSFFSAGATSVDFERYGSSNVASGGGSQSLRVYILNQSLASGVNPACWGWLYNGPDIGEFPLLDGDASIAVRTPNGSLALNHRILGTFARMQTLTPSVKGDMNFYGTGLSNSATELGSATVRVYRCINGVLSTRGTFNPPIVSNSFVQFETRFVNSGSNVEIYERHNAGSALEESGGPNWTSFSLLDTDTSPGVLINSGYWGFGGFSNQSWSGGSNLYVYFDHVRIAQELI